MKNTITYGQDDIKELVAKDLDKKGFNVLRMYALEGCDGVYVEATVEHKKESVQSGSLANQIASIESDPRPFGDH